MESAADGVGWAEFETVGGELAAGVRSLIERFRFALVGTIRRDGTPRISPVETHIVRGELMLVMIPETRKAADVARDHRIVLQSPIMSAGDPGPEFKVRGRALAVEDEAQRLATADVIEINSGWRPPLSWLFLTVILEDVTHIGWRTDGTALLSRWSLRDDRPTTVELRLDMDAGRYILA